MTPLTPEKQSRFRRRDGQRRAGRAKRLFSLHREGCHVAGFQSTNITNELQANFTNPVRLCGHYRARMSNNKSETIQRVESRHPLLLNAILTQAVRQRAVLGGSIVTLMTATIAGVLTQFG